MPIELCFLNYKEQNLNKIFRNSFVWTHDFGPKTHHKTVFHVHKWAKFYVILVDMARFVTISLPYV